MPLTKSSEVFLPNPFARLVWVSAPRPAPKRSPNVAVHPLIRPLCDDVSVVVNPAPDYRVEQLNQSFLLRRAVDPDYFADIIQEPLYVLGRRFDEKGTAVSSYILSEKVEAL